MATRDTWESINHYIRSIKRHLDNDSRLLRCMTKLDDLPVEAKHLVQSDIGKTVNSLRDHTSQVSSAAKKLLAKWRAIVMNCKSVEVESETESDTDDDETDKENDSDNAEERPNNFRFDRDLNPDEIENTDDYDRMEALKPHQFHLTTQDCQVCTFTRIQERMQRKREKEAKMQVLQHWWRSSKSTTPPSDEQAQCSRSMPTLDDGVDTSDAEDDDGAMSSDENSEHVEVVVEQPLESAVTDDDDDEEVEKSATKNSNCQHRGRRHHRHHRRHHKACCKYAKKGKKMCKPSATVVSGALDNDAGIDDAGTDVIEEPESKSEGACRKRKLFCDENEDDANDEQVGNEVTDQNQMKVVNQEEDQKQEQEQDTNANIAMVHNKKIKGETEAKAKLIIEQGDNKKINIEAEVEVDAEAGLQIEVIETIESPDAQLVLELSPLDASGGIHQCVNAQPQHGAQ